MTFLPQGPRPSKRKRARKPIARKAVRNTRVSKIRGQARKPDKGTVAKRRAARKRERDREDARWREQVRIWAGGVCERTGGKGTDCHHVWPKGAHPELRHEVDNGILLTHEEHLRSHRDMTRFRRWFASMFPQRWSRLEAARLG